MSSIHPVEISLQGKLQKDVESDDIESDTSCWREVFKTRDTRKMGKTARCLTLFHNLTIMIALLLTLFQYYEAASISLVASMIALFRVQQEEDEKFDNEDLCVAEVQQTTCPSSPRKKRRKKRKTQKKPKSTVDRPNSIVDRPNRITEPKSTVDKHDQALEPGRQPFPQPNSPKASKATAEIVISNTVEASQPSLRKEIPAKSTSHKIKESVPPPLDKAQALPTKSDTSGTVGSDDDTMAEAFDDEVAKFRARLETIQSSPDRPKIKICAGVFAKQLAAKKSAARGRRNTTRTTFSI